MKIKDFPQTSTKETKILAMNMIIEQANDNFEYNRLHQNYGIANQQFGFLNGLIEGKEHLTIKHFLNIQDTIIWAETNQSICLGNKDYGKTDYWSNFIRGLKVCEVIIYSGE